ncbi:bifunctional sugar phosphate isomerase/epimerase/4-hydroxyphenylpyruvate dioxygenase family protein [Paractinoplanes hotanensis]|uniref:3-dehydroshikimate dehydratase n=1 Tax=Paractinoplanes hotanensis TaxID=2906497 RepID=A0ABT0YEQ4_9ACTN|nr:sugar phosphate isomerase/epimerase and 4-hydroxyphenylpyruvate domain-containing protein [Actinoplanes hotanensis]MCM4084532.1 sugar phosphate isomerase/epimerase and 4-hydroxyphenylpyruvate domain-containing protein [Actinoplanes hotanensis]
MRTSIATVCLSGTLEDRLDAAAGAGFDGVEIFENDLVASVSSPEAIRQRVADLGLRIDLYQPFRDAEGAPPERFATVERRFRAKLDLMARLGADTVLICSSVAPDTVDDDALAAAQLRRLAEMADERGMRIAYEALAWGRFVSTWEHSWEIVRHAEHPALGLCLDSFHVLSRTDAYGKIAGLPGDRIFFLQLADAPRLDMDVLQWSRHHRLFPLQGRLDLAGFTQSVLDAGYRGPLSLEVFNDVFRQADPHRTAVDARRSLIALAGTLTRPAGPSETRPAGSRETRPAGPCETLTPAPALDGIAFVELGVDAETGPELDNLLRALGFAHTGQHRSKAVQLWEQGSARILLNSGAPRPAEGEAAIRAFALESTDPAASARRAAELLAEPLPRRRRQSEADLTAVSAPDGTEIFFCRGDYWLDDFLPTGETRTRETGITAIDHLSLAQPFDRYDEAALFYRSVLGLTDDEAGEFAAPFGLVRTLAVRNANRRVRLALSVPLLRRGDWAPAVPHPQSLTLLTDDLARTAAALETVPIPGNYYDDLDARTDLPPELRDTVRKLGALYDSDEHGQYLQLFTPVLGHRVFIEIVQRIGGYRGYGFANDPVRMAAHRAQRLVSRA